MLRKLVMFVSVLGVIFSPLPESAVFAVGEGFALRTSQVSASEIILDLSVNDFNLEHPTVDGVIYTALSIQGAGDPVGVSGIELPVVTAMLVIPPVGSYSIEVQSLDAAVLPADYPMLPALQPAEITEDLSPGSMGRTPGGAEAAEGLLPLETVQVEEAWMRDYRLLTVRLFPFQYDAGRNEIIFHSRLVVRLFLEGGEAFSTALRPDEHSDSADPYLEILRAKVDNPDMLAAWRAPQGSQPVSVSSLESINALPRYRIAIQENGLYRMSYAQLQAAGLPVGSIDPRTFQLDNQGRQVGLFVSNTDGNPGVFSAGEYLAFYGQEFSGDRLAQRFAAENQHWFSYWRQFPDGTQVLWKPEMSADMFEKYTQTNVYWLSYNQAAPLRMTTETGVPLSAPVPSHYTAVARAEQDRYWRTLHFATEDTFFWDDSGAPVRTTLSFGNQLNALASGTFTATVRGEVVALTSNLYSSPDHHTQFFVNDPTFSGAPVLDLYWEGRSALTFQGVFSHDKLVEGANQLNMKIFPTTAVPNERLLFNWFEIHYQRLFQAQNDALEFTISQDGPWKFQIAGYGSADLGVLDISSVYTPTWITGSQYASGTLSFETNHPAGARYYAGKFNDLTAAQIVLTTPPDLATPADYVIITHQDFMAAVQPLANYRASKGLDVLVIDQQDLYDAFTDGIYHPLAVKEFLRYAFANWSKPPLYVFLVGDGHWNLNGSPIYASSGIYMPPNLTWVDPWQGEVDSSSLLANVVGDDILPDVMIARLPVNTTAEVSAYINKVIGYESQGLQTWQRNLLFVADNVPDPTGDFVYFSNDIAADYLRPGFSIAKIYENDYGCPTVTGNLCPEVNYAITSTLSSSGAMLVSFVGHASLDRWTHEHIFLNRDRTFPALSIMSSISTLNNPDMLPVILSMTCLDGYWIYPDNLSDPTRTIGPQSSIIEDMQRAIGEGSVGAFSPTGLGVATGHDELERGFLDALFNAGDWRLGAAAQSAKLSLYASGSNYDLLNTFTIFGDPALQLRSSYAVSVTPPSLELATLPGGSVTYGLQVENTGAITDTFSVNLGNSVWQVDAPLEVGPLAPGASAGLNVMVQIPPGTPYGSSDSVEVTLVSQGDMARTSSATLTTLASEYYASWQPPSAQKTSYPGSQVVYELELVNSGFSTDSYDLVLSGYVWPTSILSENPVINVFPGARRTVRIAVNLPGTISGFDQDTALITAQSQGDSAVSAQAELITSAAYQVFLPTIVR